MADREFSIRAIIEGSALSLKAATDEATQAMRSLRTDLNAADRAAGGLTLSTRVLRDNMRSYAADVRTAERATESLTGSTRELRDRQVEQAAASKLVTRELRLYAEEVRRLRTDQGELAVATGITTDKIKDSRTASLEDAAAKTIEGKAIKEAGQQHTDYAKAVDQAAKRRVESERQASSEINRLQNRLFNEQRSLANRQQNEREQQLRNFLSGLGPGGRRATGVAGAAGVLSAGVIGAPALAGAGMDLASILPLAATQIAPLAALLPSLAEGAISAGGGFLVLRSALEGFNKVVSADTPAQLKSALQGLDHQTQLLALRMRSELKPALDNLQQVAQDRALPGIFNLGIAFSNLAKGPVLDGVKAFADSISQIANSLGHLFNQQQFKQGLDTLLVSTGKGLGDLAHILPPLLDSFVRILNLASPNTESFGKMVEGWSVSVDKFVKGHGVELQSFFTEARRVIGYWLSDLGSLAGIFGGLFRAAQPFTDLLGGGLAHGLDRLSSLVNSPQGQHALKNFFSEAIPTLNSFLGLVGNVVSDLAKVGASPQVQAMLRWFFDALKNDILPVLNGLVQELPKVFDVLRPLLDALGGLIHALGPPLVAVIDGLVSAMAPLVNQLATIVNGLTALINLGGPQLLAGGATLIGGELLQNKLEKKSSLGVKLTGDMTAADLIGLASGGGALSGLLGGGALGGVGANMISDPLQQRLRGGRGGATAGSNQNILSALIGSATAKGSDILGPAREKQIAALLQDQRATAGLAANESAILKSAFSAEQVLGKKFSFSPSRAFTGKLGLDVGGLTEGTALFTAAGGLDKVLASGAVAALVKHIKGFSKLIVKGGELDALISGLGFLSDVMQGKNVGKSAQNSIEAFLSPLSFVFGGRPTVGGKGPTSGLPKQPSGLGVLGAAPYDISHSFGKLFSGDIGGFASTFFGTKQPDQPVINFGKSLDKLGLSGKNAFSVLRNMPVAELQRLQDNATSLAAKFPEDAKGLDQFWHAAQAAKDPLTRLSGASDTLKQQFIGDFQAVMQQGGSVLENVSAMVRQHMQQIAKDMGTNSAMGRKAMAANMIGAAQAVAGAIAEGVVATGKGMAKIRHYMEIALKDLGVSTKGLGIAGVGTDTIQSVVNQLASGTINNSQANTYLGSVPGQNVPSLGGATGFVGGDPNATGPDGIPLWVAKGEAVVNRPQRAFIDSMLGAFGTSVANVISRQVTKPHTAAARGYAASGYAGYSLPLPKNMMGGAWSIDQGVDINGGTGAIANQPLFAIGPGSIISEGITGFGPNAPILRIDQGAGPLGGREIYYGHAGPDTVKTGQHVNAGQQISEVGAGIVGISTGPHLEIGFANNGSPGPMGAGGAMEIVLQQLLGGAGVTGVPGGHGGIASLIPAIAVGAHGVMHTIAQAAVNKVRNAANAYIAAHGGGGSGVGAAGVNGVPASSLGGGWFRTGATMDTAKQYGFTEAQFAAHQAFGSYYNGGMSFAELLVAGDNAGLSSHSIMRTLGLPSDKGGTAMWARAVGGNNAYRILESDVGSGQRGDIHYTVDLHEAIANAIGFSGKGDIEVKKALLGFDAQSASTRGGYGNLPTHKQRRTTATGRSKSTTGTPQTTHAPKSKKPNSHVPKLPSKIAHAIRTKTFTEFGQYISSLIPLQASLDLANKDLTFNEGVWGNIEEANQDGTPLANPAPFPTGFANVWDGGAGYSTAWKLGQEYIAHQGILGKERALLAAFGPESLRVDHGGKNYDKSKFLGVDKMLNSNPFGLHHLMREYLAEGKAIKKWKTQVSMIGEHRHGDAKYWKTQRFDIRRRYGDEIYATQRAAMNRHYSLSQQDLAIRTKLATLETQEKNAISSFQHDGTVLDPYTATQEKQAVTQEFKQRMADITAVTRMWSHRTSLSRADKVHYLRDAEALELFRISEITAGNTTKYGAQRKGLNDLIATAKKRQGDDTNYARDDVDSINQLDAAKLTPSLAKQLQTTFGSSFNVTPNTGGDVKSSLFQSAADMGDAARTEAFVTIPGIQKQIHDFLMSVGAKADTTPASTGQSDLLSSLYQEQAYNSQLQLGIANQQLKVLAGFAQQLGARSLGTFAKGGVIDRTGMALVHRHETIIPDPQGPFKSYSMGPGGAPSMEVHMHGGLEALFDHVEMLVDRKVQQVVSEKTGTRSRRIRNAPGGH